MPADRDRADGQPRLVFHDLRDPVSLFIELGSLCRGELYEGLSRDVDPAARAALMRAE